MYSYHIWKIFKSIYLTYGRNPNKYYHSGSEWTLDLYQLKSTLLSPKLDPRDLMQVSISPLTRLFGREGSYPSAEEGERVLGPTDKPENFLRVVSIPYKITKWNTHTHTHTHTHIYIYIYIYIYIRGPLNKLLDFFRMGTFIDSTHETLVPFQVISPSCNALVVPFQQLLEGSMDVLLCERVNDLRHSLFHLLNCLITTASKLRE